MSIVTVRTADQFNTLVDFHCNILKNGIREIVNDFPDSAISAVSPVK